MEKKLQVRDLRISFRTTNGKVQAVRGIDFDLNKGETLAIVGESGSGKSVTSKAILGIQAGNSITESGEIIYDGKDLLKITEEDFHKIRGDKIAMIFQDPMSSLNPIVKIGKQLTEATILKGKIKQRESKKAFNSYLNKLNEIMIAAIAPSDKALADKLTKKCMDFDKFECLHIKLEAEYLKAFDAASEAYGMIDDLALELKKNVLKDALYRLGRLALLCSDSCHEYVVDSDKDRLLSLASSLKPLFQEGRKSNSFSSVVAAMEEIKDILGKAIALEQPNFFRMGYYLQFSGKQLPDLDIKALNEYLLKYINDNFMLDFLADAQKALQFSAAKSYEAMSKALEHLRTDVSAFKAESLDRPDCMAALSSLTALIKAAIDPLAIVKDSLSFTFHTSMKEEVDRYFAAIGKNARNQKRYDRQKARYDRLTAKGRQPDYTIAQPDIIDLELIKLNMAHMIDRLSEHYTSLLAHKNERDYRKETVAAIDYLMDNANGTVTKVTNSIARDKALKLMEEVGIDEPRKRFNQYPFEFSGGMRQRIVIAIALAANPDILICDEPTTALDVTIQAQILELINKLKTERKLSVIFITHDLGVVANMADRIAVMYAGKIVEYGTTEDIFYHSVHPYTWALLSSMPDLDTNDKLEAIPGTPPNMIYPPKGDAFAARNKYAMAIDFEKQPPMFKVSDTHYAATWLLHPNAPKVEPPKSITDRIARMKIKREAKDAK